MTGTGYTTTIGDTTNYMVLRAASANSSFFFNGASSNGPGLTVAAGLNIAFASGTNAVNAQDTILTRDAPNTLALRNGGTDAAKVPQTFNIYNYHASASDYERGFLKWNSNVLEIGTEAGASGGTDRETRFVQGGSAAISIKSSQVEVSRLLIPSSTGGTSLGAATKQWNNFYASGAIYLTGLPASDPVSAGQLWNDSGTLKVSAG